MVVLLVVQPEVGPLADFLSQIVMMAKEFGDVNDGSRGRF